MKSCVFIWLTFFCLFGALLSSCGTAVKIITASTTTTTTTTSLTSTTATITTTTTTSSTTTTIETHTGAITLSGTEIMTIEGRNYVQVGDITISQEAQLHIINSSVTVRKAGPRANINLYGNGRLVLVNSRLTPPLEDPANLYLTLQNSSSILIDNSMFYNVLNFVDSASFVVRNNSIVHSGRDIAETDGAFGIIQINSTTPGTIENSEIGSIALFYGNGESAVLDGLAPGTVGAKSILLTNITNSTILSPSKKGPFERGWAIFADEGASVTIRNSNLNKFCFQEIRNRVATVEFSNLRTEQNMNLSFESLVLENVSVYNQWGFFTRNTNLTVSSSEGVWLWPQETGAVKLVDSMMNEFDPRTFTGELIFENSTWEIAGEILENNNFALSGTVSMDAYLRDSLVWDNTSVVRRIFPGNNIVEFNSGNYKTAQPITYNSTIYNVDFFTRTPF